MSKAKKMQPNLDRIQGAWSELNRAFSPSHLLLDNLFSAANRFDEVVGDMWEEFCNKKSRSVDYLPATDKPSFTEIERCFNDLAQFINKIHTSPEYFQHIAGQWLYGIRQRSANLVGAIDWLITESDDDEPEGDSISVATTVPDFSHRMSPIGFEHGTLGLVDSVNMAADKLLAVATMLSDHFAIDDDENRPSDETVFFALQSIKHEAQDIKAIVGEFHAR